MKKQTKSPNLLDLVPHQSQKFRAEIGEDGAVTIFVENKGVFNFIAQKFFKKPRFTQIHLEEFGSFIWQQIDGIKTVKDIADLMHEQFGENADPLYPRISMYMKTLLNYEFIEIERV
ncbi:MAG: PqqD family protein [Treponema sp.]|nr:PqqD family protein [Treponema sp.]